MLRVVGERPQSATRRRVPDSTFFIALDTKHCHIELFDPACRAFYRARLFDALERHGAQLHAYMLHVSEVQLLISAPTRRSLERLLEQVQRAYLSYFNQRFKRQVRAARTHTSLCQLCGDGLIRETYRHIERRLLVVGESRKLGDSEWSSYPANAFGRGDASGRLPIRRLTRHRCLDTLMPQAAALAGYRDYLDKSPDPVFARFLETALRERVAIEEVVISPYS